MTDIIDLLASQTTLSGQISRAFLNFQKLGAAAMTLGACKARLEHLEKKWAKFQENHDEISSRYSSENLRELAYFTEDVLSTTEELYLLQKGIFLDKFDTYTQVGTPNNQITPPNHAPEVQIRHNLPRIDVPKFSGKYQEWANFRDLFKSMIHDNNSLSDIERMHYLKNSLLDEAVLLLQNIAPTAANFARAWQALNDEYQNLRILVNVQIASLCKLKSMSSESLSELKHLFNSTNDAIGTLRNLNRPVDNWDDWLVYITVQRLDTQTRRDWENSLGATTDPPNFETLKIFLSTRIRTLESLGHSSNQPNANVRNSNAIPNTSKQNKSIKAHPATKSALESQSKSQSCPCCKQGHYLGACSTFKSKLIPQRFELVRSNKLCFNCLGIHALKDCRSHRVCRTCFQRHHSLLHDPNKVKGSTSPLSASKGTPESSPTSAAAHQETTTVTGHIIDASAPERTSVLLGTATVSVSSSDGTTTLARALLDPCAECNFVSESLAQRLKLSRNSTNLHISGIGATPSGQSRGSVKFTVSSRNCNSLFRLHTYALVLPRLTEYLPPPFTLPSGWHELNQDDLADPNLRSREPIELLLGCEAYSVMLRPGLKKDPLIPIIAQQTTIGWILTGPTSKPPDANFDPPDDSKLTSKSVVSLPCVLQDNLPQLLQRFWEQEEVPKPSSSFWTDEEQACDDYFSTTHSRNHDGRYIVRLPFKKPLDLLGDSHTQAMRTLRSMEHRFQRNQLLQEAYIKFLDEYSNLNHMEETSVPTKKNECFYLPHHGVIKESSTTTKLRVVFNGSQCSTSGVSLNDLLHTGPKLQSELSDILLRWRTFRVVFSADIEKMFRQILIHPDDRDFQRILWRTDTADAPRSFRLTTVTYGLACSPYLAIRVLKQLAKDETEQFPLAASTLDDHFYVDDLLGGADDIASARDLQAQFTGLLMAGGLPLRKWTSNDRRLLEHLPPEWVASSQSLNWQSEQEHQMLGLHWRPETDNFVFRSTQPDLPEVSTKRTVLSSIAKLFDPLGWLAPLVVTCKVFMRTLWEKKIDWDSALPLDTLKKWINIYDSLRNVHLICMPRWLGTTNKATFLEIHGFSDASTLAYAAVIYLRVGTPTGQISSRLVCAKTKVAPVKQISIPKLELCGAQLLVRLTNQTCNTLHLYNAAIHLWTDSTNVLSWIRASPATWKTFVANRVSYIQTTLPRTSWHHIDGKDNPADCATRGLLPEQLAQHELWWSGPSRLTQSCEPWVTEEPQLESDQLIERRIVVHQAALLIENDPVWTLFAPCASSFIKLLRVTAWCKRWLLRLPRFKNMSSEEDSTSSKVLSASEIDAARLFWIRTVQQRAYHTEIKTLSTLKLELPRKSSLISLKPFLDQQKLLRVGGRLRHSILDPDEINPIILPRQSPITDLIIDQYHRRLLHGGIQLTLATLRRQYWIPQGRLAVKVRINHCHPCIRFRATTTVQQMGNLPADRVRPSPAFSKTGVDYCGPVPIRTSSGRGMHSQKGFIAVFVCLSTRAVHLEAVSNYSSAQFLAAFRRFTSRRGIPEAVLSDCGTNFIGADTELRRLFRVASRFSTEIAEALENDGTAWRFNPPGAPHHGGIWEAAVKSVKHHLKRVLGDATLTYEELSTLLAQIEACLNSRPLQAISDDPDELSVLTPGHFLIGRPLVSIPEPSLLETNPNRLERWKLIQKMHQDFWKRWSTEYLSSLQNLPKWKQLKPSVKIGDLAILKNESLPPSKWLLCRVIATHPGDDGLVRVVTVRTASSTFKRPITKLCLLPIPEPTACSLVSI